MPIRTKTELAAAPMKALSSFTKRQRGEVSETSDSDWGGGSSAHVAPTRRERGKWIPPPGSKYLTHPIESSRMPDMESSDFPDLEKKDTASRYGRLGRGRKRAKFDIFDAPRLEPPPSLRQVGDSSKAPSTGNESDDQPQRVSPPPEVNWASKARQALPPQRLPSMISTGPVQQRKISGGQQQERPRTTSVRSSMPPSGRHQLPPDHPLMIHLTALQRERQNRKFQWAELIDTLGDEFRNPASYDQQLWLREEQKADEAIVDTLLQIKMAERGLDAGIEDVGPVERGGSEVIRGGQQHHRGRGGGMRKNRQPRRYFDNKHGNKANIPLHKQDRMSGGVHVNFKGRKENGPSKRPMRWDEERKDDAVRTWLREMGMPELCPPAPAGGSTIGSGGRKDDLTLDRLPATKPTRGGGSADAEADDGEKSFISLGFDMNDDDDDGDRNNEDKPDDAQYLGLALAPSSGLMAGHGHTSPWSSPVRSEQSNADEEVEEQEAFDAAEAAREAWRIAATRRVEELQDSLRIMDAADKIVEGWKNREAMTKEYEPTIKIEPGSEEDAGKVIDSADLYEASEVDGYEGFTYIGDDEESGAGEGGVSLLGVETVDLS